MPRKPLSIVLVSLGYLLSVPCILIQTAIMVKLPLIGGTNLFQRLGANDWIVLALYVVCAVAIYMVRPWGWYVFVVSSLYFIVSNTIVFMIRPQYSVALLIVYNLGFAVVTGIFFRRALISPFFNPRLRWWESDPRFHLENTVEIHLPGRGDAAGTGPLVLTHLADLSRGGCFVKSPRVLDEGREYPILLHCMGVHVSLKARVMREFLIPHIPGSPGDLYGYGLMFISLPHAEAELLGEILSSLETSGFVDRNREQKLKDDAYAASTRRYKLERLAMLEVAGHEVQSELVDISESGALVKTSAILMLGESYATELRCAGMTVRLTACVRWHVDRVEFKGYGISFDSHKREERRLLRTLTRSLRKAGAITRTHTSPKIGREELLKFALQSPYKHVHRVKAALTGKQD